MQWFCLVCVVSRTIPLPCHVVMPRIWKCAASCGKRDCAHMNKLMVNCGSQRSSWATSQVLWSHRVLIKGLQEKLEREIRRYHSTNYEDEGRGKRQSTQAALVNGKRKKVTSLESPGGTELCQLLFLNLVNPTLIPHTSRTVTVTEEEKIDPYFEAGSCYVA